MARRRATSPASSRSSFDDDNTLYTDDSDLWSVSDASMESLSTVDSFYDRRWPDFRLSKSQEQKGYAYEGWSLELVPGEQRIDGGTKLFNINFTKFYRQIRPAVDVSPQIYEQPELIEFHLDALDKYHAKHKRSLPSRLIRGKPKTYEEALDAQIEKLPDLIQAELNNLLSDRESATSNRFHYRAWEVVMMREQVKQRFANADPQEVKKHKVRFWKNKSQKEQPTEYFFVIRGKETKQPVDPLKGFTSYRRGGNPWDRADRNHISRRNREVRRQRRVAARDRVRDLRHPLTSHQRRTRAQGLSPIPEIIHYGPSRRRNPPMRARSFSASRPTYQPGYVPPPPPAGGLGSMPPPPPRVAEALPRGPGHLPYSSRPPYTYDRYEERMPYAPPGIEKPYVRSYPAPPPPPGLGNSYTSPYTSPSAVPPPPPPGVASPPPPPGPPCFICPPSAAAYPGHCYHGLWLRRSPENVIPPFPQRPSLGPRFVGMRQCQSYPGGPCAIPACCHYHGPFVQTPVPPMMQDPRMRAPMPPMPKPIVVEVGKKKQKKKKKSKMAKDNAAIAAFLAGKDDKKSNKDQDDGKSSGSKARSRSRSRSSDESASGSRRRSSSASSSSSSETSILDD